ncbi:hypothetical protein BDV97DRAFT_377304 [Delphinella strobiligena]|nr:hypothetical protein BDV97DRAFT_377304 [Delphinella strobiligena]
MSASPPNKSVTKPYDIAIVGGGIGGIVLAIGLLRQGVPVHIYEAAKGFGEIGAGIAFGPNSVRALALVSPDLLKAYKKHATYNESPEKAASWLTFRHGMDSRNGNGKKMGDVAFDMVSEKHASSWTGTCVRSCVHRARFLDEIIKFIPPETTSFGKSLTGLEEIPDAEGGGVRLNFADGSSATASAVIGCDGVKSKTRKFLLGPDLKPTFTGEYAYRALVPAEAFEAVMGHDLTVNGQLYVGYGGYVISYPVNHAEIINLVAVQSKPGSEWKHKTWLVPSTKEEMETELEGWHPGIVELLSKYGTRDKWALHDLMHDCKSSRGRICLLGDSFHASTPHLGAGAGQALEDAYILSNLLGGVEHAQALPKALEAYDTVRRPRSQQVVKFSRDQGFSCAFDEKEGGDDVANLEKRTNERYAWIWDEDLECQLDKAKALMA